MFLSHLKTQDDGPDETQGESVISIHDVMGTNIFQVNSLLFKKLQGFVHIFQAVDPHSTASRPWLECDREKKKLLSRRFYEILCSSWQNIKCLHIEQMSM